MGEFYSIDLHERIFDHIAAGHSCRAVTRVFGVSASKGIQLAPDLRNRG